MCAARGHMGCGSTSRSFCCEAGTALMLEKGVGLCTTSMLTGSSRNHIGRIAGQKGNRVYPKEKRDIHQSNAKLQGDRE